MKNLIEKNLTHAESDEGQDQIEERFTSENLGGMFGRKTDDGNIVVLWAADGCAVTQIDANVYPVDSDLSARYEHADGIVLTVDDAERIGIEIE